MVLQVIALIPVIELMLWALISVTFVCKRLWSKNISFLLASSVARRCCVRKTGR